MKRIASLALPLLLLWSCIEVDDPVNPGLQAIGIGEVTLVTGTALTKASPAVNVTSLNLFCAHTGTESWNTSSPLNHFSDASLRISTPSYYVGDTQYWRRFPIEGMHTFFAYSGTRGVSIVSDSPGVPVIFYSPQENSRYQPDLMIADKLVDKTEADNPLKMKMYHALSCVRLEAINRTAFTLKIQSISVSGVYASAATELDGKNGAIVWTTTGTTDGSFSVTPSGYVPPYTTEPQEIHSSLYSLMMIPQKLGPEAKITVTEVNGTEYVFSLDTKEWLRGKQVTYVLDLKYTDTRSGGGKEATLHTIVRDWE